MKTRQLVIITALSFASAFAGAADPVVKEVDSATRKVASVNNPTTNTQGKACAMKAASAPGKDSEHKEIVQGNAKSDATCDAYISDSGTVGRKGKHIQKQLQDPAYSKLALEDDELFGKGDIDGNAGGTEEVCPNFRKMSKPERAKVYIKVLAALAKVKSGCASEEDTGKAQKKDQVGDFKVDTDRKKHEKWGNKFAGSKNNCGIDGLGGAEQYTLCATDMLMEQLKNKDKKEQQAEQSMDDKKKRQVGIFSKQSFWKEMRPPEDDGEESKELKAIKEDIKKYKPCGAGDS